MSDLYSAYRSSAKKSLSRFLQDLNSNFWEVFSIILVGLSLFSCYNENEQTTNRERSRDELDVRIAKEWTWELDPSVDSRELSGRMMVITSPKGSGLYALTKVVIQNEYPRSIKLKLPVNEQISGTVSVALDTTSEAASISVDGWLRSKSPDGSK